MSATDDRCVKPRLTGTDVQTLLCNLALLVDAETVRQMNRTWGDDAS